MKKLNARRFVALALALLMILPVISIPAFASGTSQTSLTSNTKQAVSKLEALFSQDFEAFDTINGPVAPGSGVFNGPRTARVIAASNDEYGNVLKINCQAAADDGRYWVCFNQHRNYWVEIKNVTTQKAYYHPSSAGGVGANISGVDFSGASTQTPMIYTNQYVYITDGTVKTPGDVTYRVRGIANLETFEFECIFYSYDQVATDYEGMPAYEYEYEPLYMYEYEYEYEYELQYVTDANGNFVLDNKGNKVPVLDINGNTVYALDENGQKIVVTDENGNPQYAHDSAGYLIPKKDSAGNMIIAKDENGNNLVYRYEYAYEAEPDADGNKVPVLDENGNHVYQLDENGEKVYSLTGEGERVAVLDENGQTIALRYPNGELVPALDAEGNIIYKVDADGSYIEKIDAGGNPVYQYNEIGIKIPKLDENGEIIPLEGELKDIHGKTVYQELSLESINYKGSKLVEKKDENGNVIYEVVKEPVLNEDGSPKLDENGDPVMAPVMIPDLDENGNQIMVETDNLVDRVDADGNPVYYEMQVVVYQTDENGNVVTDENGDPVPVKVQATTAVRDENDQVVYQYVYDGNGNAEAAAPYWDIQEEEDGTPKVDKWGNVIEYWVYPAVGKPILQQQTDEAGNLLYDANGNPLMEYKTERLLTKRYKADGTPQMMVLTEVQLVPYKDKEVVPAPDIEKTAPAMVEEMSIPITSLHIANTSLQDAYGGGTNVAREAYIQSGTINSDLLVFSSDYYFSEDLTKGVDIRITAIAEDGSSKTFEFANISNPDLKTGTVDIRTDNAPTHLVTNSVKVPLGTWCNIMIIADLTSGTYALYVNGELISVKQNVRISQQMVEQEVIVNSQTALYEYVPGEYEPLKDENGNIVMTKQLDADGNPVMRKLVENGLYVYDETTGEHIYEYLMVPVMVPKVKCDDAGNPIVVMGDKVDENGNIVYENAYDENGNPIMTEQLDADGNVVMIEQVDSNGYFIKNDDGTIKMAPAMVPALTPVQVPATTDKYNMVYGEDGVLKTQFCFDDDGNIVTETREDFDGNSVEYPIMIPVEELATEVLLDAEGNPVTEKVPTMAPESATWTMGAVGIKAGTWNLGHFIRGGNVSDYQGYMCVDNIAIYDGKDIDKVFAAKGYALDYNETYDGMSIGDVVKIEGKNTSSTIMTDPAGSDDQVLRIDYADAATREANYTPATEGFTYMSADKVVLEANYFLAEGSAGRIDSQFWNMGAMLDVPNAAFAYSNEDSITRIYRWIELYTIKTAKGATQARVTSYGSDDPEMMIDLGKWYAFSFVLDLSNGEYTLYINGLKAFTGRLCKEIKDVDGITKTFYFRDIAVGGEQWITSRVSEGNGGEYEGSFYLDDVTVTKLGGERAYATRIGGLLSADIYANGEKVATVTDDNYFFCSDLIKLENVEIYDIGIEQLLRTDDTSIRFTSPSGIRFTTWVDVEALDALYEQIRRPASPDDEGTSDDASDSQGVSLKAVSFGTLIIPTDLLDGRDLTFEVLEETKLPYLDVKGTRGYYYDADGDGVGTHIAGSLMNIKEENIGRLYSAVSYVRIVLESGIVYNIYGHRVAKTGAQSLADDVFGTFTPAEQEVIDAFLAGKKPAADFPPVVEDPTTEE